MNALVNIANEFNEIRATQNYLLKAEENRLRSEYTNRGMLHSGLYEGAVLEANLNFLKKIAQDLKTKHGKRAAGDICSELNKVVNGLLGAMEKDRSARGAHSTSLDQGLQEQASQFITNLTAELHE